MTHDEALRCVSKKCLGGRAVPEDLARLWKLSLEGHPIEPRIFEIRLLNDAADDLLAPYLDESLAGVSGARANARMFEQIHFVAVSNVGLVGYWVRDGNQMLDAAPVVAVDDEGQFRLCGRNMAEYLIQLPYDAETYEEVRTWVVGSRVVAKASTTDEITAALDAYDDPDAVWLAYEAETQRP